MQRQEPEYYSISDVANILSISESAIRGWIKKGKCPFIFNKIGGNLRIRKTALETYLRKTEINQRDVDKCSI